MQILNPDCDFPGFLESVSRARQPVLLLDYDGTLAPFRPERDRAFPYPGVREVLTKIIEHERSRVVVVSGRSVDNLLPLLNLEPPPEVWGSHGLERLRRDGTRTALGTSQSALRELEAIKRWVTEQHLESVAEIKPSGVAFHWRGASRTERDALERKVVERWSQTDSQFTFELSRFDGGVELRLPGVTKGRAVAAILAETDDDEPVAYLGDDQTDEDAFRALSSRGLSVLVRPEWRETTADIWISPPEELLEFLDHWR